MTSDKKIESNRKNAEKGTGPKTEAGKRKSAFNALKYGACAQTPVLPGENAAAYKQLVEAFIRDLQPKGPMEEFLVGQIIGVIRRLSRCEAAENHALQKDVIRRAAAFAHTLNLDPDAAQPTGEDLCDAILEAAHESSPLSHLDRYRQSSERRLRGLIHDLWRAQHFRLLIHGAAQEPSLFETETATREVRRIKNKRPKKKQAALGQPQTEAVVAEPKEEEGERLFEATPSSPRNDQGDQLCAGPACGGPDWEVIPADNVRVPNATSDDVEAILRADPQSEQRPSGDKMEG